MPLFFQSFSSTAVNYWFIFTYQAKRK